MRIKSVALLLVAVMVCSLFCGCSELQSYRPIDDVHNLQGRRIGVCCSWASDYLLTPRDDMTLVRYNTIADMVTALCYKRLDVAAVERSVANYIMSCVGGLGIVEEVIATHGLVAYVTNGREDLLAEFNEFISEFNKTEEYADIIERFSNPEGFVPAEIDNIQNGKKLKISTQSAVYPFCYVDFETGGLIGSDMEIITHFANAYGYTIEISAGEYTTMQNQVVYGQVDMAIGSISDLWNGDVEMTGLALVSDAYMYEDIVFIEIVDSDALKIISTIE